LPSLSVVMIVRDEAAVLAECLSSVRAIADEIIAGDTGSTDDTAVIARDFGACVIAVPWRNDFAWARNQVLAHATGDWLLHVDADEVVGDAAAIRAIVEADGAGADAIELTLANYCDTPYAWRWVPAEAGCPHGRGYAGYVAVPLLRLFRNHCGYEYRETVHENITESVLERGGVIGRADILIHHYGYADAVTSPQKSARYLDLAEKKARDRPEDVKAWHDLAEQRIACGKLREGEAACRRALALDPGHVGALSALAMLLLNRGHLDEARALLQPLADPPPHLVMALGAIAEKQGRLDEARARLETAIAANPQSVVARLYLARTLDRLGDTNAARNALVEATEIAPGLEEPRRRLEALTWRLQGESLYREGNPEHALHDLVRAMELDPEDPLIQNNLGVVLASLGQPDAARAAFERALKLAPGMPEASENLKLIRR
jgi:Flp pilus assembly protein TadD